MRYLIVVLFFHLFAFTTEASIKVALTFDDLPLHSDIPKSTTRLEVANKILDTLKRENIWQTYGFVNGKIIESKPELKDVLKVWIAGGQNLGNHSYTHMNYNFNTIADFLQDIKDNEAILSEVSMGTNWHYFRYPYLQEGNTVEKREAAKNYLSNNGYRVAPVTMSFDDWAWNNTYARCKDENNQEAIEWLRSSFQNNALKTLLQVARPDLPQVLLIHFGAFDAEMISELIKNYKENGVQFIKLDEATTTIYRDDIGSFVPFPAVEINSLCL
jgi:peptidoglycan/xylan/chitin deacetylase (PgdA/CDA1 family)